MTDIKEHFGANVRTWRRRRGISQEQLAERANLHRTYVTDIERGARNVSLEIIERLARALEVQLAVLFTAPEALPLLVGDPRRPICPARLVDILLVEDNPNDVALTLRAFRKAGLKNHLHVVTDGADALDFLFAAGCHAGRLGEPLPQVVLLDLKLPKLDGLEVLRRIRREPSTETISVVVLSASQDGRDLRESRRLGADAYIVKPVNFEQLTRAAMTMNFRWGLLKVPRLEDR
jgi:CheY-like chemotaxis protein/DNA-binding XRE family transcriptional regulator